MLNSSLICLFADIIYDRNIINKLKINNKKICLAIDTSNVLEGTMRVIIKKTNYKIGSHIPVSEGMGNFIGIAKFSKNGALLIKKYLIKEKNNKEYYTYVINKMIADGIKINYIDVKKNYWKEIDTNKDLVEAKTRFKLIKN